MNNRDKYIKEITRCLNILRYEVESLSKINLTDYNIIAENFYKDLLKFYGYNLINLNEIKKNADSIDLVDKENKIAIQVTSRNDTTKIHDTIKGFYTNPEYSEYGRLIILLIGEPKQEYPKTDFTKGDLFSFDKQDDIIDIDDIIKKFSGFSAEQLEPIVDFLRKEISLKIELRKSKPNEIITIINLIEYLSNENNYKEVDKPEIIDPDKKRYRFKDHFDFLMEQYMELYPIYNGALEEAKNMFGLDGVRAKIISYYLKEISDDYLISNNNNPKIAIDTLANFFEQEISSNESNYNKSAIKFYILDELINCNVFPNPKE